METLHPNIHDEMEQEDLLIRSAIKSAAFEYESHGDPRRFEAHIAELMEGSKSRQREIFARYNGTAMPRNGHE